jgi:HEPN domain-containing protein
MPHDDRSPDSPQAWLRFARADLAYACRPLPDPEMYELACFHIQQAAEKALKAVLVFLGIDFPYTHNIQALVDLLPEDVRSSDLSSAPELNAYAVLARYPRDTEDIDEQEYAEALSIGETVLAWAERIMAQ